MVSPHSILLNHRGYDATIPPYEPEAPTSSEEMESDIETLLDGSTSWRYDSNTILVVSVLLLLDCVASF